MDVFTGHPSIWGVVAEHEGQIIGSNFSGRGKASGLETTQFTATKGGAILFNLRGGKVTTLVIYFDRENALADLGLAPEAGSSAS
jgi:hypothetical protein